MAQFYRGQIDNNKTIILAVMVIAVVVIISVTVLLIARPGDNSFTQIIGFAVLIGTQLLNNKNISDKVEEVHKQMNGRLDELVEAKTAVAKAEGVVEGIQAEKVEHR